MIDVFISCRPEDEALARPLAEAVKAEGYGIGWDDEPAEDAAAGIGTAKATILVWSSAAAASREARARAEAARGRNRLVQVSIDGRMPPMPFNQIHCAMLDGWRGEAGHPGWAQVKASLVALCGPRDANAAPLATPQEPARNRLPLLVALGAILLLSILGIALGRG